MAVSGQQQTSDVDLHHGLSMKNIQVIDGAVNCVYDIFAATDEEFGLIFPDGQDIAFIDEVYGRGGDDAALNRAFEGVVVASSGQSPGDGNPWSAVLRTRREKAVLSEPARRGGREPRWLPPSIGRGLGQDAASSGPSLPSSISTQLWTVEPCCPHLRRPGQSTSQRARPFATS
jgi:hypothetical protein